MNGDATQKGSRMVEPPRKRKQTPSDRAREARRLVRRLEDATGDRQQAWVEGDRANLTERLTDDLDGLHGDKRTMRRAIYTEAPELEGRPVFKGQPGGRP